VKHTPNAVHAIKPWQVLGSKTLLAKRWLTIREEHVRLTNGHEIEQFHVIEGPNWASVLCITEDMEVVLVRQYRHGVQGVSLELPAGVIERDEDPLLAAQRELREETGFEAAAWQPLISMVTEPTRHTTRAHFFYATAAKRVAPPALDASEEMDVVLVPKHELVGLVERGEIFHGSHIGPIMLAAQRGWL
jgi:8-oxo-dGTP pyrophosphatase MutT (NUDIX family)